VKFQKGVKRLLTHSWRTRLIVGAVALALVGCAALGAALRLAPPQAQVLAASRGLWDRRAFSRYRLVTEHTGGLAVCRQEVEVLDERVVARFVNTCPRSPLTVGQLFLEIERYNLTIGGQCGPNGCACDGPIEVDVTYDRRLGYPRRIEVRSKPERRWLYLEYWRRLVSGGGCTLIGFSGPTIEVVALTPLP
jgi:hypothetical protein